MALLMTLLIKAEQSHVAGACGGGIVNVGGEKKQVCTNVLDETCVIFS